MTRVVATAIPARLDRLPWSRFHSMVVAALGITWILDGLEVTLVGSLSPAIKGGLALSDTQIGFAGSAYILGAVMGALLFGRMTDHFGRRKLFTLTVVVYLLATIATGFSWDFASFLAFRFLTGAGIGGEYGAVNSAIQELIPARRRGVTDLAVNGSFWLGAAMGAMGSLIVLDPQIVPQAWGWRLAFVIGGMLAAAIEARVERDLAQPLAPLCDLPTIRLAVGRITSWRDIGRTLFVVHPRRTVLGVVLMATQAFCYNAIFFTYALILTRFYGVAAGSIGWFMLPFALGNVSGPLILGPLFDSLGRRTMIAATYGLAGALLCVTGWMFAQGWLTATTQTLAWCVIFFFASAGASAAYLTVGELFPLETRAVTISLFYAFGTLLGGVAGPALFGALIDSGARVQIFWGYLLGGGLMLLAALAALALGVRAERRPLEEIAPPLSLASGDAS